MATKIIKNFTGRLTRDTIGELDSGYAKYAETFGNDPFSNIGNLTWLEAASRIDAGGSVITDLIVAAKPRLENGITYVYAIGHTGRLYKIQVNQPSGYNPNLDSPMLITTLTIGSPTFKYGTSIQFYGGAPKIYIGHDKGVTSVNFDGTGESEETTFFLNDIPRPSVPFKGKLYWPDNGGTFATIDSTLTFTHQTMTPNIYPLQIRDLDVTPDGSYIVIIASEVPAPDITTITQDTNGLSTGKSYKMLWNGEPGTGITSYNTFDSYSISSNASFLTYNYTTGYDFGGTAVYSDTEKILSLTGLTPPSPNALFSAGNLLGMAGPESNHVLMKANIGFYGQYDFETPKGLYRFLRMQATGNQTDIIQMPVCLIVSNLVYGPVSAGYANNVVGSAKMYFSTLETSAIPTTGYKLYSFTTVPTGLGTCIGGVYETQNETSFSLLKTTISKKFLIKEVRFYTEPLVVNNSFKIDLIGSSGNPMSGGTQTFTVGSGPIVVGQDVVKYTPQPQPTYSIGIRITNLGSVNWVGVKLEMDYEEAGTN